jgi:hypothetical protein
MKTASGDAHHEEPLENENQIRNKNQRPEENVRDKHV